MASPARKPGNITGCRSEAGMTLMEVLAALGILVLLLAVLSQLLHTGGRMWVKTDYAYQRQQQLQDVFAILTSDLRLAYWSEFLPAPAFSGDDRELSFWRETGVGLQQVTYSYDVTRRTLYRTAGFWGSTPEAKPLLTNFSTLRFEYFEAKSRNWEYNWTPRLKTTLPSLVKLTAITPLAVLGPVVIPLEAWHDEADD